MKLSFVYAVLFSIMTYLASIIGNSLIPLIVVLGLNYYRRGTFILLSAITLTSYLVLYLFNRLYDLPIVFRALIIAALFFFVSDNIDRLSLGRNLGEFGIYISIALSYYPIVYDMIHQIGINIRARKVNPLNLKKITLPIIYQAVNIAESLYIASLLRLPGKYKGKLDYRPTRDDIIILALGVVTLCLSLLISPLAGLR
ncbi:MAG: hypothetical protein OWQ54_03045 [Sulfolobaceae archaeon]|nr:hypothetical protein [Sulfolobaceae archaeon]